jgi:hypothetical protein
MDRDERLIGGVVAVEDDFSDQEMGDPLPGAGVLTRRVPRRREIPSERD